MIKIIEKGKPSQCPECACVFSYEKSDLKYRSFIECGIFHGKEVFISCPNCHKELHIQDIYE